jgi:Prolipoprotein diacylglyceryltransferase
MAGLRGAPGKAASALGRGAFGPPRHTRRRPNGPGSCSGRGNFPAWPLAEAASLSGAALVAVGRWGCLAQGCCYGKVAKVPWAVRFPFDPVGISRHPTQLYESFSAFFLLALMAVVERHFRRGGKRPRAAVLWPLFLAGYGSIRIVVDRYRGDGVFDAPLARAWGLGVFLLGAGWLCFSLWRISTTGTEEAENR